MIGKIMKGSDTRNLLGYLVGPGRSNEHTNPQVVAGSDHVVEGWRRQYAGEPWRGADLASLTAHLDEHLATTLEVDRSGWNGRAVGVTKRDNPHGPHVVHVALAIRDDEGSLPFETWQRIAEDYVAKMGAAGCRWTAIHHGMSKAGNDHIHLVINRVQADGAWLSLSNDFARNAAACRELEVEHQLERLADRRQHRGMPGFTQADARRGVTVGEPETVRLERLVRGAAKASIDEAEFVRTLRRVGVEARARFETGGRRGVVGYSVRLEGGSGRWYGPAKWLATDLSLPKLRASEGWPKSDASAWVGGASTVGAASPEDWAGQTVAVLRQEQARWRSEQRTAREDRRRASDLAGLVGIASTGLESTPGRLARAARELARWSQHQYADPKPSITPRDNIAIAARNMMAAAGRHDLAGWLAVIDQLGRMSRAIADAHEAARERVAAQRVRHEVQRRLDATSVVLRGELGLLSEDDLRAAGQVQEQAAFAPITAPAPMHPPTGQQTADPDITRRDHHDERSRGGPSR
ncbi:relaxase/mobilization nuclease domain-containing protein [Aestuariimicrobium sp. T2.26MG-19.2B]|uniref:relaxase/mobilization nuclease domain-containing protein n=1 Tax=Aestuariimicrobium sp. T2.26MG-19.2B TaxID=3040679 RepID=UPI002477581B|nr:relaxase/mobilization nuclease domain-containing protein [Aestuariimicrobium sp. T2.26MG-19.2B]CAI9411756.1 hypothetical protein AESSP_02714 [Aestuariimicrobium sp. T2.26MG-19.2B]